MIFKGIQADRMKVGRVHMKLNADRDDAVADSVSPEVVRQVNMMAGFSVESLLNKSFTLTHHGTTYEVLTDQRGQVLRFETSDCVR